MEGKQFDIAVVGELNPDLILHGDVLPEFGQAEKLVDQAALTIGSSSAIFACGAARLGMRVAFIGKVGKDLFGQFMRHALEEHGIATSGIIEDSQTNTGISVILAKSNDRAILTYPGTIPLLQASEINLDILKQSRHVHVGSYFIQDKLRSRLPQVFDQAHEWGLTTSLDTNYDPRDAWNGGLSKLLPKVDVLLPNAVECQRIAHTSSLEVALGYLQAKVPYLGVKQGKDGATLCANAKEYHLPVIPVKVVDTVGAGDSFDAGFIYAYLAGWDAESILRLAIVCGSLSTRQAGGTAAQPTIEEAVHYLQ